MAAMGVKGPERPDDECVRFAEPKRGVYKSVVIRDGKLIGAMLLGDVKKVAFLTQSFDRGLPLPEERVELLFELAGPSEEQGAAEMDDSVQVCNCNGVSKGDLVACVRGGEHSVTGCMNATRAGKGCGACKPLVKRHRRVGGHRGRRRARGRRERQLVRPGDPDGQADADRRDQGAEPAVGVGGAGGAGSRRRGRGRRRCR